MRFSYGSHWEYIDELITVGACNAALRLPARTYAYRIVLQDYAGRSRVYARVHSGSPPNLHTMVPGRACIQGVLKVKVKVKDHVIRTLVISRKSLLLAGK